MHKQCDAINHAKIKQMNKLLPKFLFSRVFIASALILLQVFWFVILFLILVENILWVEVWLWLLSAIMTLAIIISTKNPAYKISWLVVIGLLPLPGGLLYLLLGNKRPARQLTNRLKATQQKIRPLLTKPSITFSDNLRLNQVSQYLANQSGFYAHQNTSVTYFSQGETMFEQMLIDLRAAQKFILLEYFIVSDGHMWQQIEEILITKAKAGLDVRVMYDDLGSIKKLPPNFKKRLEKAGVLTVAFNPLVPIPALVMNNRDHRKILVIDGQIGFTGGINIADEYINQKIVFGHWKDSGIRLEGEAVNNLTAMFFELWSAWQDFPEDYGWFLQAKPVEATGLVQPFFDSPLGEERLSENLYMDILWQAQNYAFIFTPYLVITNEMLSALTIAAKRGVDVRLVVPEIPDKKIVYRLTKSYFNQLTAVGVKIYTYTPGFLHSKSILADDRIGIVGTINLDFRSLYLHFETGCLLIDSPALTELKQDYQTCFKQSRLVQIDPSRDSVGQRLLDAVLRVISPLM